MAKQSNHDFLNMQNSTSSHPLLPMRAINDKASQRMPSQNDKENRGDFRNYSRSLYSHNGLEAKCGINGSNCRNNGTTTNFNISRVKYDTRTRLNTESFYNQYPYQPPEHPFFNQFNATSNFNQLQHKLQKPIFVPKFMQNKINIRSISVPK